MGDKHVIYTAFTHTVFFAMVLCNNKDTILVLLNINVRADLKSNQLAQIKMGQWGNSSNLIVGLHIT